MVIGHGVIEIGVGGMQRIEIEDVARFLGVSPKNKIKTLAMMISEEDEKTGKARSRAVILLMRGDHQMNEAKLSTAVGGKEARPMQEEEIRELFKSPAGYLGPLRRKRACRDP